MNFLDDLNATLKSHDKKLSDILWVGTETYQVDLDLFFQNANFYYDSGFGSHKIPLDLIVVGDNWWLERGEYDGSEWWIFRKNIAKPTEIRKYTNFKRKYYENSLEELNEGTKDDFTY